MCRKTIFIKTRPVVFFETKTEKVIFSLYPDGLSFLSSIHTITLSLHISKIILVKITLSLIQIFFIIIKKITRLLSFPYLHSRHFLVNTRKGKCEETIFLKKKKNTINPATNFSRIEKKKRKKELSISIIRASDPGKFVSSPFILMRASARTYTA